MYIQNSALVFNKFILYKKLNSLAGKLFFLWVNMQRRYEEIFICINDLYKKVRKTTIVIQTLDSNI